MSPFSAAKATSALKAELWFRLGRLVVFAPLSRQFYRMGIGQSTYFNCSDFLGHLYVTRALLLGIRASGIGGRITTRGVAFLSGIVAYYVRDYGLAKRNKVRPAHLPAGGQSIPAIHLGFGRRQYPVVVVNGHGYIGTKVGDVAIDNNLIE